MISKIKTLVICMQIVIVLIMGVVIVRYSNMSTIDVISHSGGCVPDEETAIRIAQAVVKSKTGVEFDEELLSATSANNDIEWEVHIPDSEIKQLVINKNTATITAEHIEDSSFFEPSKNAEYLYNVLIQKKTKE